jgi:TonB family protein
MKPSALGLVLVLLPLAILVAAGWLGRRFWQRTRLPALKAETRYRAVAEQMLLAGLWHLLLYGASAVFFLPWGGGRNWRPPTPLQWQAAQLHHEGFVLAVGGLCGALVLLLWHRWRAALCWLAGGMLLVGGTHGHRAYTARLVTQEAQRQEQARADSVGHSTLQPFYDAHGNPADPATLPVRRAIPFENLAQPPAFPGGGSALQEALRRRVRYPQAAQGREVPVEVVVKCIVEPDGRLTVLTTGEVPAACEGLGYEQEAVRAVRSLPPLVPGQRAGRAVAATYPIPVVFRPAATAGQTRP